MLFCNFKKIIKNIWYNKIRKPLEVLIKWVLPAGIPFIILLLQFTPILHVSGISDRPDKIYFLIKNDGNIPAYSIKGRFVITSNAEPEVRKTSKEKIITSNSMNTGGSVIFYPTGKSSRGLVLMYPVDLKGIGDTDFIFLSAYFEYPQFKFVPFFMKQVYEGVFQYDKTNKIWVSTSRTMYPDFFTKIFRALRNGVDPQFASIDVKKKEK